MCIRCKFENTSKFTQQNYGNYTTTLGAVIKPKSWRNIENEHKYLIKNEKKNIDNFVEKGDRK